MPGVCSETMLPPRKDTSWKTVSFNQFICASLVPPGTTGLKWMAVPPRGVELEIFSTPAAWPKEKSLILGIWDFRFSRSSRLGNSAVSPVGTEMSKAIT